MPDTHGKRHRSTSRGQRPSPVELGWSPFHTAAEDYLRAGYMPIPLPAGHKAPPPAGVPNDIAYSEDQLNAWLNGDYTFKDKARKDTGPKNIGSIVPDGVVVFDIDGEPGQETLTELEEKLGPLPPTWLSFRGNPDRYHLWFSCPEGLVWPGKLGTGLDIIYRHYRYMVMPPSIHPDGGQYRWANLRKGTLRASGSYLPEIDEFADLPESWLVLANPDGYVHRERAQIDSRLWVREHGKGKPCSQMKKVALLHVTSIRKHADLGGMHDAMVNAVWALMSEMSQGHAGGYKALAKIKKTFLAQADESGRRKPGDAEEEWSRACIGAAEKTAVERVREGDPCINEEGEDVDPDIFFDKHGIRAQKLRKAVEAFGEFATSDTGVIFHYSSSGLWTPDGEKEIVRRSVRLLGDRYRVGHSALVDNIIKSRKPLIIDDEQDTRYLNLPNGLLEWETGELIPHNKYVPSTIRIPIEWNDEAECPEIDRFFREVFPDDAIELAYEILGYMLYNGNPLHKAILLYGSGRNGKGTFIRLARMLVGHNNISAVTPQALDASQFSSSQLYGKLANLVGDVDPRIFKSTEQFKQLTGGDTMMAQYKHRDPFYFTCRALMVAAFNALPRTADTTEGFFSRWAVVPFTAFFPAGVADPTLIGRLTAQSELQGLLRYALGGLQHVMRRGRFTLPASVEQATERFKREADPVRGFIDEMITFDTDLFSARSEIYSAYVAWSATNGFHAMSAQRFYESFTTAAPSVSNVPVSSVQNKGIRGYRGIAIR
jgi:putative DNA primase/helicase